MLRLILGVVLGIVVGAIVTGVVEGMGHTIFPPPPGVDLTNPAQLQTVMSRVPMEAKIAILLAWFLGVLAGSSTANLIAGRRALAGRITSLLIFCFAAWTMTSIPASKRVGSGARETQDGRVAATLQVAAATAGD